MNITIEIAGTAAHVEFGHLTSSDLVEIYKDHTEDPDDLDNIPMLSGGNFCHEACSIYFDNPEELQGPNYSIEAMDNGTDKKVDLDLDSVTFERTVYVDDEDIKAGEIRYNKHIDTKDSIKISVVSDSKAPFDSSKLKLQYFEFNFDGAMERSGKILTAATYDGEECELESDGGTHKNSVIQINAYAAYGDDDEDDDEILTLSLRQNDQDSNEEYDDVMPILDQDNGETTWDWEGIEKYLKSQSQSNENSESTVDDDLFAPEDPVVLIKISKQYKETSTHGEIYQFTRKQWVMSESKLPSIKYVVAAAAGLTREVYSIDKWYQIEDRWAFYGHLAPDEVREKYKNKKYEQKKGAANPISYFNI